MDSFYFQVFQNVLLFYSLIGYFFRFLYISLLKDSHRRVPRSQFFYSNERDESSLSLVLILGGEITQLPQLLLCVCETVQDEALALIDSMRHVVQKDEVQEDRMETDAPRCIHHDQRDSVSINVTERVRRERRGKRNVSNRVRRVVKERETESQEVIIVVRKESRM